MTKSELDGILRKTAGARRSLNRRAALLKRAAGDTLAAIQADQDILSRTGKGLAYAAQHPVSLTGTYLKNLGTGARDAYRAVQDRSRSFGERVGTTLGKAFGPKVLTPDPHAGARGAAAVTVGRNFGLDPAKVLRASNARPAVRALLDARGLARRNQAATPET